MEEGLYLDSVYWTLIIVNVIPFLVALVANEVTKKGVKEGLLAILSGIAAWAAEVFDAGGSFVVEDFVLTLIVVFLGSAGMFFGWQRKTVTPALERSGTSLGKPN